MSNEQNQEHLGKALIYEDQIPLLAEQIKDDTRQVSGQRLELQNLKILRLLWNMQESLHELPEQYHELESVFLRLDNKLDVLLELLGQIASQTMDLPPQSRIRLNSIRLSWLSESAPQPASRWQVECYVIPSVPTPLTLSGRVCAIHPEGSSFWIELELEPLGELVADLLDKIIFRAHRRAVARQRHSAE
jgi:hypothetical protein